MNSITTSLTTAAPQAASSTSVGEVRRWLNADPIGTWGKEAERIVLHSSAIERAISKSAPHHKPLFLAVRDHNVGVMFIGRHVPPRLFQTDHMTGLVVVVGDDRKKYRSQANLPHAYRRPLIISMLLHAQLVCVHEGVATDPRHYGILARAAAAGEIAIGIGIERPVDFPVWRCFVKEWAPESRKLFITSNLLGIRIGPVREA